MKKIDNFIKEHIAKLLIGGIVYSLLYIAYQSVFVIPKIQGNVDNLTLVQDEFKQDIKEIKTDIKQVLRDMKK